MNYEIIDTAKTGKFKAVIFQDGDVGLVLDPENAELKSLKTSPEEYLRFITDEYQRLHNPLPPTDPQEPQQ